MVRLISRVFGIVIGGGATLIAAFASIVRLEGGDDLKNILEIDVSIGLALAVAILLVNVPATGAGNWRRHCLTTAGAMLIGAIISGGLVWSHLEQHRIRSTPLDVPVKPK